MRTNPELAKRFIGALSAESIAKRTRHEIRQGHPTYTEAEIDLMVAAIKKQGFPARDLAAARKVLASYDLSNSPEAVENQGILEMFARLEQEQAKAQEQPKSSRAVADRDRVSMAKEQVSKKTYDLNNSPDEIENRKMIAALERILARKQAQANPLPIPTAGSQPHTYPGVAELVMAHTLLAVASDDAEMRLWASDIEFGARSLIRLHLGWEDDGVAN
jgi:hypothetical protein